MGGAVLQGLEKGGALFSPRPLAELQKIDDAVEALAKKHMLGVLDAAFRSAPERRADYLEMEAEALERAAEMVRVRAGRIVREAPPSPPSADLPPQRGEGLWPGKVTEEDCPGHVGSRNDPKICDRCGVHVDSLRPPGECDL